jgi:3'-5' exoribonuclease
MLITGVLLHDIGKTVEFEGPAVFHYSLEGKLIGHISIMVAEIREAAHVLGITSEVPLLLQHMVLSHHNEPEFGSPVPPLTKEAFLLTMIDNLDSKMMVIEKALDTVDEGEFTQKLFPLNGRMLYKPKN